MLNKLWDETDYPFPNFNRYTVEGWEWIIDLNQHFIIDVISRPCCVKFKPCV